MKDKLYDKMIQDYLLEYLKFSNIKAVRKYVNLWKLKTLLIFVFSVIFDSYIYFIL